MRLAALALVVVTGCSGASVHTTAPTTTRPTTVPVRTGSTTTPAPTQVRVDLDGDGRSDRFDARMTDQHDHRWTYIAALRTGARLRLSGYGGATTPVVIPIDLDPGVPGQQLLVTTGGNTWDVGDVLLVHDGRLRVAEGPGAPAIGWGAHSNGNPMGTADVACAPGQLLITSSEYTPSYDARTARRWTADRYRLEGATFVLVDHREGMLGLDEPPPRDVPLDNRLSCGGITLPR